MAIKEKSKLSDNIELISLIKSITAQTATDDELKHLLYISQEYNLDPLKKELYFIKYNGKSTLITSRDGYLKIANLNLNFNGLESDVVYQGDKLTKREDGSLHIEYGEAHLLFDKSKLTGAYCSVFRKDRSKATSVFVSIKDYFKRGAPIWEQYINAMILKVAESMALKRAFAISGLVTQEEIDKEIIETEIELNPSDLSLITDAQKKAILTIISAKNLKETELLKILITKFNKDSFKDLSKDQARDLISFLNQPEI